MEAQQAFLTEREHEAYTARYPNYPRRLRELSMRPRKSPARTIAERVRDAVGEVAGRERVRRTLVVDVIERDGRRWSATAAVAAVRARDPDRRIVALSGDQRPDGLPALTALVGEDRLRELARRCAVLPSSRRRDPRVTIALFLLLILLGIASFVLGQLVEQVSGVLSPQLIGVALGVTVIGLMGQLVLERLRPPARPEGEPKLPELLRDAPEEAPGAYARLVEALTAELSRARAPRCVVVGAYDRLDPVSHDVVHHYVGGAAPAPGGELWIVFESVAGPTAGEPDHEETGELAKLIMRPSHWHRAQARTADGVIATQFFRQDPLSEADRASLAEELGVPERAQLLTVGDIAHPALDVATVLARRLDEYRAANPVSPDGYGPLELLYLLALRFDDSLVGREELASDLSTSRERSEVLQALLGGSTPLRTDVQSCFDELRAALGLALDDQGELGIRVTRDAARVVLARREALGLGDPRHVHLFWALFIHDAIASHKRLDAFRLRALNRHLHEVQPSSVLHPFGDQIAARMFTATLWAAERSLRASLVADVPALLERAESALGEQPADSERARLRSLAALVYALMGEDRALAVLLQVRGAAHPASAGAPAAVLDRLFAESLTRQWSTSEWRERLALDLDGLDEAMRGYARVRALWLALVLRRPSRWREHMLDDALREGIPQLHQLVRDAVQRVQDPGRELVASDVMTMSLGLWCSALVCARGGQELEEMGMPPVLLEEYAEHVRAHVALLEEAFVPADDLATGRAAAGRRDYDLPRDCLAQELQAMIGAGAHIVREAGATIQDALPAGPAATELDGELAKLDELVEWASGTGDEAQQPRVIVRNMSLVRFTWRRLGFRQLAAFMALRWAHFYLLVEDRAKDETLRSALSGIVELTDERGFTGLMANGVAAIGAEDREASAAPLLCRGIELALGRQGDALSTDLCLTALDAAHTHPSVDLTRFIRYLLEGDGATECRLGARLGAMDDDALPGTALVLLNAIGTHPQPDFLSAVPRELQRRSKAIADAGAGSLLSDEIKLFELDRQLEKGNGLTPDAVLETWRKSPHWASFARSVAALMRHFEHEPALLQEAADILEAHPGPPPQTAPLILAYRVAVESLEAADGGDAEARRRVDVAVAYLEEAIPHWERHLEPDTNIAIYGLLIRESAQRGGSHIERRERWIEHQQEQFLLSSLRALMRQGMHFQIVWHYFSTLDYLGLEAHPRCSSYEIEALPPADVARILEAWRTQPGDVPPALVSVPGGRALGGEFLRRGYWLFAADAGGAGRKLDAARRQVNAEAQGMLDDLYEEIASLESIPEGVRQILRTHRQLVMGRATAGMT